ncbi:CRTAC1 family protein [Rhodospirillum centenum]|uniref:FG-GAP repeat protein n=1 Tax=Rhodospirillum centenum (strain ATCC 51521 / SW) TaxID=414684 RepID=B6IX07_RHOCS|nr:CRTAC1 family protein [Rhodospirillum centenum]ACJ00831.1 FG-GAP repeat protein [Rhodospirillum centenum SW]
MFIACSNLIARNPAGHAQGLAVADVDGDGRDEILVAGQPNRVLKWDGHGLADMADPVLADPERRAVAIACADLDGDGREEVYVLNGEPATGAAPAADRLFAWFGSRWIDLCALPENLGAANRDGGRALAVLDRSGEGRYGVLVAGREGALRLYELDRRGRLHDMAEEAGLDVPVAATCLLAAPLFGEAPDVVVGGTGPNLLFRNLGDGGFEEIGGSHGVADPGFAARAAALLDSDGDGLLDLVVANGDGPHRLFQRRAGGGFADIAPPELAEPGRVRTVIAADFDNDGHEELLVTVQGGPNRLFAWRDERWTRIDPGDAAAPHGTAAVVADLDGDGQLELLLGPGGAGPHPLSLFLAEPRGHHWLRVRPLTRMGAPARGAVVRLTAGGRTQIRVIDGGGTFCQREPVAHFGLGAATRVERLEVRWPDGAVVRIDQPQTCRMLTLRHPG